VNPGFTTNFINDSTNFPFFSFTVTHPVSIDSISVTDWTNPVYWDGAAGYAVRISPQNASVPVPGTAYDASGWAHLGVLPGTGTYSVPGPGVLDPGTYTVAFPGVSTPEPGTTQLAFNEVSLQGEAVQEPTQTALSSSLNPSIDGHSVTLTATVTGSDSGQAPTGSVTFMDGSQSLGTATIDGSGAASLTTAGLAAGSHQITASYSGDEYDQTSSQTLTQVVQPPANPVCPDPPGAYNRGFNAGFNSGSKPGFNSGFNTGFQRGFAAGFGRPSGHASGIGAASPSSQARGQALARGAFPPACDQAFHQGFNTGFHSGFNSGFGNGFNSGFNGGFNAGYKARHSQHG
jgi:hypothetical protein